MLFSTAVTCCVTQLHCVFYGCLCAGCVDGVDMCVAGWLSLCAGCVDGVDMCVAGWRPFFVWPVGVCNILPICAGIFYVTWRWP